MSAAHIPREGKTGRSSEPCAVVGRKGGSSLKESGREGEDRQRLPSAERRLGVSLARTGWRGRQAGAHRGRRSNRRQAGQQSQDACHSLELFKEVLARAKAEPGLQIKTCCKRKEHGREHRSTRLHQICRAGVQ